jgi:two-component system cell cycle sensor histidine kinase/response regulator CckA
VEPTLPRGSETILVAEDEDSIRVLICRSLAALGYQVIEAGQPEIARIMASENHRAVDLLVTDVQMHQTSGPQLAERLAGSLPGLKVLFISGYANAELEKPIPLQRGQSFLEKPFSMGKLATRIRELLDDRSPE